MARIGMMVVVGDEFVDSTKEIAREIGNRGLQVDSVVPAAGAIHAIGDEADMETVRKMDGVHEVTPDRGAQLPPMDEKIPQ